MDRLSAPSYEKVAANDPELDSSDDGTLTPSALPSWRDDSHRRKQRSLRSIFWLCIQTAFVTASIVAWGASLWLTHLASSELGQARSLIAGLGASAQNPHPNYKPSLPSTNGNHGHNNDHSPPDTHHDTPNTMFIPGGTLPVPGYGLAYNTSYCNGWADPAGALARGCVLDPSQGGWVHELCHDPELRAEWLRLPDFGWYLDPHRRRRVEQESVWNATGLPDGADTVLYTDLNFHVTHCKFVMRLRVKNGMRRNRGVGYLPLDPGHMYHCIKLMTEDNTPETRAKELTQVVLGKFGGGTEGFGLGGECYMPML